jgi:hypothetical protein
LQPNRGESAALHALADGEGQDDDTGDEDKLPDLDAEIEARETDQSMVNQGPPEVCCTSPTAATSQQPAMRHASRAAAPSPHGSAIRA